MKKSIIEKRSLKKGISNGKPFETLCTKDLDWLRMTIKELDIFKWKNAICYFCTKNSLRNTSKSVQSTKREMEKIKKKTGLEDAELLKVHQF